jgi:hypothetical protein
MSEVLLGRSVATATSVVEPCETVDKTPAQHRLLRKLAAIAAMTAAIGGGLSTEANRATAADTHPAPKATAAKATPMRPLRVEVEALSWASNDSPIASVDLGSPVQYYTPKHPLGTDVGPELIDPPATVGTVIGFVSRVTLTTRSDEITGPCTFNGNQYSYVATSSTRVADRTCAEESDNGTAEYDQGTVKWACNEVGDPTGSPAMAQCEDVDFQQALTTVGDQAAASVGLTTNRYGRPTKIVVVSDAQTRTVHWQSGPTVEAVSDAAETATIDFADDHNPGHQLKSLELEMVHGHVDDHLTWYKPV